MDFEEFFAISDNLILRDGHLVSDMVTHHGFGLRAWSDRKGGGVWLAVLPMPYLLDDVEYALSTDDIDSFPSANFLLSQEWIPVVLAKDLDTAKSLLENKLCVLELRRNDSFSTWSNSVVEVIEHLKSSFDNNSPYGGETAHLNALSSSFRDIWD